MIRFIIVLTVVVLLLVGSIPILIYEGILGKINPKKKDAHCLALIRWSFGIVAGLSGARTTIIGKENIPADTAVLYVANHRSYFDIILTCMNVPSLTGYVAKTEMLRYPLLVNWMRNIHCTFLDRKNIKKGLQVIQENVENLKNGISVFVFPEGTRNKTDELLLPFHDGSLKMAERSGVPIVPVTINNSEQIFEAHMPKIKKGHVIIEFGKPIYMNGMTREEKKQVSGQIQQILKETYIKNAKLV